MELRERLAGNQAPAVSEPVQVQGDSFVELKDRIHMAVISELGPRLYNEALSHGALRDVVLADVRNRLSQERGLATADRERLTQEIANDTLGHGPIEPLLQDDTVTEVMVNGPGDVWVERSGRLEKTGVRFTDDHHLRRIINKIVAQVGRRVDESSPMVDARLPDGSRVNAVLPPLSLTGPLLTIRKFSKRRLDLGDLVAINSLPAEGKEFLEAAIQAELNILISGGTGSGKTTLLNALSTAIQSDHRIVTIEDAAELRLNQDHVLRLEARPKNVEGQGEIPIRELVRNALRMRPDRIIVGEVRGSEAFDMLQAMNTGHDGSLSTCHANTPRDAIARIESMVLMAGIDFPMRAIRQQVSRALDLVVQIERFSDGTRKITSITEVQRMEGDTVTLQDVFEFQLDKTSQDGNGKLAYTGLRPVCGKFERHGVALPSYMQDHSFGGDRLAMAAPGRPGAPCASGVQRAAGTRGEAVRAMSGGSGTALVISIAAGLLIGVAVLMLVTRRGSVADRVSVYVTSSDVVSGGGQRSLIERALGDKQARTIARSPFITRLRLEMEVADLNFGLEQLFAMTLLATVLLGWLLATSTHSPVAALLALFVPFLAKFAIGFKADRQRRQFSEQLPDNLRVIASAMRSGQNFVGALAVGARGRA